MRNKAKIEKEAKIRYKAGDLQAKRMLRDIFGRDFFYEVGDDEIEKSFQNLYHAIYSDAELRTLRSGHYIGFKCGVRFERDKLKGNG